MTPPKPRRPVLPKREKLPRAPRGCCQSGCDGCEWAKKMRALGKL